jgi:ATP adenylyltransferase
MTDQHLKNLWAPWRLSYVASPSAASANDPCFICRGLEMQDDRQNLLVMRTPMCVVFLNRFPYNNGHLLVAPRLHKGGLEELVLEEMSESMCVLQRMILELNHLLQPDGYNIGLNLGCAAGAGLPGHLHWHVVPRWHGDTSFMPIVSDTKVIPQSLDSLYDLLVARFSAGEPGG